MRYVAHTLICVWRIARENPARLGLIFSSLAWFGLTWSNTRFVHHYLVSILVNKASAMERPGQYACQLGSVIGGMKCLRSFTRHLAITDVRASSLNSFGSLAGLHFGIGLM